MTVWKEKYFLKVKLLLDILIYIFILKRVVGFDEEWKYNNLKTHSLNDYKKMNLFDCLNTVSTALP